jgi:alanine dehydrogenase
VARTSTQALTQATLPYALKLANLGLCEALRADAGLRQGLQVHAGKVTHAGLAEDTQRPFTAPADCLA